MNGFSMDLDGLAAVPGSSASSLDSYSSSSSSSSGANCIEHRVSKMDTVAGIAIKYGVEVADIRRMNGLVTDLQMFAHKTLQIPLPGRHPPSPIQISNGSIANGEKIPSRQPLNDILDSFSLIKLKPPKQVSPAMSSLQGYYGLTTPKKKDPLADGTEMAVYRSGKIHHSGDELLPRESPASEPLPAKIRKSSSLADGFLPEKCRFLLENGETADVPADSIDGERFIRRRQKADGDSFMSTPERLLEDTTGGGFSGSRGKNLAQRPKSGSRTDVDMARVNTSPSGDTLVVDGLAAVRKSSSTSNLQESQTSSSIWPSSKWSLRTDALARPLFDGLPKPVAVRRSKAALD